MKKIINKIQWIVFLPLWVILLIGYFIWNFIQMSWLAIKKNKIAQKIIYSDLVQTQKEKLTGRPKIIIK